MARREEEIDTITSKKGFGRTLKGSFFSLMFRKVEDFTTMFVWPSSHSLLSKAAGGSRENPFLAGRSGQTSKTGFSISVCGPGHEISGPLGTGKSIPSGEAGI